MLQVNFYFARLAGHEKITLKDLPSKCPFCHHSIVPIFKYGLLKELQNQGDLREAKAVFVCPRGKCSEVFVGTYYHDLTSSKEYDYNKIIQSQPLSKEFSQHIEKTSSSFVKIYNEAFFAEQDNLKEISGIGYRKALEFLIKDYLIERNPENEEKVKSTYRSSCINKFVDHPKIKSIAKRAAWLGNDHAHYTRKWRDKDLHDLKILIELTIRWIEMEKMSEEYEEEMPE